jgi:hypothetical protein
MEVAACPKCGASPVLLDDGGVATCFSCHGAGDATRIPMTDEAVLAVLREHFHGIDAMYLCPSIPGKRELAARAVHARHLPSDERVLALFDDTVFGSGDDGFLVTSQRLCWKNVADRAHMIEWQHVDPDRMYADRRKLNLGSRAMEISGDESITRACEEAFHVLAFSARVRAPVARSGVVLATAPSDADDTSNLPTLRPSRPPVLESGIASNLDLDDVASDSDRVADSRR